MFRDLVSSTNSSHFESRETPNSSVIVLLLFIFIWVGVLSLPLILSTRTIEGDYPRYNSASRQRIAPHPPKKSKFLPLYVILMRYLDNTIPDVFGPRKNALKNIFNALRQHHRYCAIFSLAKPYNYRYLAAIHLLTLQGILNLSVILFLNLQVHFTDTDLYPS